MPEISTLTRRKFLCSLAALGGISAVAPLTSSLASAESKTRAEADLLANLHAKAQSGSESIVILIYPGFTAIDAIAPEYILSGMMGASVRLIAKTKSPVKCETGFEVIPNLDFGECPKNPTLILVPGGTDGLLKAIEDKETVSFLKEYGAKATMVGSVCTGSLLLGAAGLLQGYEATSHWQTVDLLPLVGAKPNRKRVVFDRNRVTGAGVTAGLDLALELVQRFRGDFYAKGMQLLAQYDPHPPFPDGGNPEKADLEVKALLDQMHAPFIELTASTLKATQPQ